MELASFPLLFTFLLLLFMLIKKGKRSISKNTNSKLPPGPWKLPYIGSLHHMLGQPHQSLRTLAKRHGPLIHLQLGEVSTIVVSSSRMAKEVMKTHDLMLVNRPWVFGANVIISYGCKNSVPASCSDYRRQLRKLCILELLSARRGNSFQSVREAEVANLIQSISSMNGSLVNLSMKIFSSTNDIILTAAFGKIYKDKQEFISLIQQVLQLGCGFSVADLFPSLKLLHIVSGIKPKLERIHHKVDKILQDIIEEHKKNLKDKKDDYEDDLVDVLLHLQQDTDLEFPITVENIKAVILDIFTWRSETSSTVIEWAMSEMLRNPRVMEMVQAEVRRVLHGKREIKEMDIQELYYLKAVIEETFRLHPPLLLLLPRESRERCDISGYEIPKNSKIIINAWAIGRDPDDWSDADRFNPERFNVISVDNKGANVDYIPFGAGRRIRPGILFGTANVELPLAQLLYHFDWKLPTGVKPEELDMTEAFGVTVRRRNNLILRAIPYIP